MSTTSPTKRGPYAPTRRRRETIARVVLELVDAVGHEGVTTALVSQRSGINETTILYHFPSRDHLLVAALALADDEEAERADAYADDAVLDIGAIARVPGMDFENPRFRLFLMLRGQSGDSAHPATEYFKERAARQVALFAQLIRHSQEAGLILDGLDPVMTARQIIAIWDGLGQLWQSDREFDVAALLEDSVRRLTGQNLLEIQRLLTRAMVHPGP
ncbi:TetR family transcriptional regulator [Rathayibacter sp. VKM Ac-2760]|uniref:TetR/AcrR family transcriptional regulator n=1 Tax=Rathayibacter sp. VKM Ac-2760 TaxID=2609253 RepID=UPI0013161AA5|nr:TetR family transcriptional regulator [Rathayibacter sp. VKM Ac-2760]QHC61075.1 TetR family transcriptional regulator [Rathayibacter sp. VKM Ac-2760]